MTAKTSNEAGQREPITKGQRGLGIEVDGKTDATGTGLLPCPFCGGEAHIITAVGESWILCEKCKASAEAHTSMQSAVAAWNRRAK